MESQFFDEEREMRKHFAKSGVNASDMQNNEEEEKKAQENAQAQNMSKKMRLRMKRYN